MAAKEAFHVESKAIMPISSGVVLSLSSSSTPIQRSYHAEGSGRRFARPPNTILEGFDDHRNGVLGLSPEFHQYFDDFLMSSPRSCLQLLNQILTLSFIVLTSNEIHTRI